jgi:hypothetical protein
MSSPSEQQKKTGIRNKVAKELGLTDVELAKYEYIKKINPKVWNMMGGKPDISDIKLGFGARLAGKNDRSKVDIPRYFRLGKTLGLSEQELINYDYIQSINPRVLERNFGCRPSPTDIVAPVRFRPHTVREVQKKQSASSV